MIGKKRNISKNKKDNYDYDRVFLEIIDTIQSELEPEPCRDEKELQGNLKTFLKTKYYIDVITLHLDLLCIVSDKVFPQCRASE